MVKEARVAVLGAGNVGKTALTLRICSNVYVEDYDPTISDSYRKQIRTRFGPVLIDILDCTTNDEYSALVDEWIRRSDVFLLTCSLTKRKSLEEVEDLVHRIEKIRDVPSQFANMVLVATQCDDVEHREITKQELKNISSKYGISQCFEVSAKTGENVQELFTCAAERGTDILSGHDKLIQKLENGISVASEQKKCNIL